LSLLKAKLQNKLLRARLRKKELPGRARSNLAALDHLDPARPATDYNYVVLDLETTGMDLESDRVVSVGAVRLVGGRIRLGDNFAELVNPGRDIPVESIKIHGVKPDQTAGARHASAVFQDFLSFLGSDLLVAHYARFELHFINFTMQRLYGFNLQNLTLDTVALVESLVLPSDPYGIGRHKQERSLEALARRFGISQAERHTALGDALLTALIFQQLLARLRSKRRPALRDLLRAGLAD